MGSTVTYRGRQFVVEEGDVFNPADADMAFQKGMVARDTPHNDLPTTLDGYQTMAISTATYPGRGQDQLIYPVIALAGETGELAEAVLDRAVPRRDAPREQGVGTAALVVVADCGAVMELIKKVYRNTPGGELFPGSKQEITDAIQLARSALGTLAQVVRTAKQVEFPAVPADDRDDRPRLVKETGDILWYVACFCTEIHVSLGYVGDTNYAKLADRARRDVIRSTGDDR